MGLLHTLAVSICLLDVGCLLLPFGSGISIFKVPLVPRLSLLSQMFEKVKHIAYEKMEAGMHKYVTFVSYRKKKAKIYEFKKLMLLYQLD